MTPEQNFVSKHLVIASYGTSSIFVASFLDTEKPLSKINFVKAKQKSLANVYADSDTTYLVFNDEL